MRRINQLREVRLLSRGLYLKEAQTLKSVPLGTPYFRKFINDRTKLKQRAIKEGWTATKLEQAIRLSYEAKTGLQRGQKLDRATIFKMLRWYESEWRNTAPDDELQKWVSPSAKKSHHGTSINREKLRRQKQAYNNRPEVKLKRAEYRRTHRSQIAESRRKAKLFKKQQGGR